MCSKLIVVVTFVVSCGSVWALIGEDGKQIETRYGKPVPMLGARGNYREVGYVCHGFMIFVQFMNGVSKSESFARPDKSAISPDSVEAILALGASQGVTWRDLPPKEGDRFWSRSDGRAKAIFPAQGNFLIVQDPDFVEPE